MLSFSSQFLKMQSCQAKKSSHVSGNWPGENVFNHLPTCMGKCVSVCMFLLKKSIHTQTQTQTKSKRN